MSVSIEQLQAFCTSATVGSFSQAGKVLNKAQSVISNHVSNLEADLGVVLFDRSRRNPVLTEEGKRLLSEAQIILEQRENLMNMAQSLEKKIESKLVIAIDEIFPENMIGEIFAEFSQVFPHVEIELLFPLMDDVAYLVKAGKVDIGISWQQSLVSAEIGFRAIGQVPIQLVCGLEHPLTLLDRVTLDDLKRHRQILIAARHDDTVKQNLRIASEVWSVESHWVTLQLLQKNIGWAFISQYIIEHSMLADYLARPKSNFMGMDMQITIDVLWDKRKYQGVAAKWLLQRLGQLDWSEMNTQSNMV